MIGRFIRFYPGYTAEAALRMPAVRFWALYGEMAGLRAEELREQASVALVAANPGEDGAAYRELVERLDEVAGGLAEPAARAGTGTVGRPLAADKAIAVGLPGVVYEAEPGSIAAERERQKAAWLRKVAEAEALGIHINV